MEATTIRLREWTPEDDADLRAIHAAQGLGYEFPQLETPLFVVKLVAVDENGKVRGAVFARLTAEIFCIIDPTMEKKQAAFREGMAATERLLFLKGLDDVHAFVPPKMNGMGKVLESYGFQRDWQCFCKQLGENNGARS